VHAWGKEGHAIVGNIAYKRLSNSTRSTITAILFPNGTDDNHDENDEYWSPLGAVASWADNARYTKEWSWTGPLHFVDVEDGLVSGGCPSDSTPVGDTFDGGGDGGGECVFEYGRDCKEGWCVVGAVVDFASNLIDNATSYSSLSSRSSHGKRHHSGITHLDVSTDRRRKTTSSSSVLGSAVGEVQPQLKQLRGDPHPCPRDVGTVESLKFLVHMVGDVHQPLHVSRASDKGGNTIHVHFPEEFRGFRDGRTGVEHKAWNLHSVWDTGIIHKAMKSYHNNSQNIFQQHIEDKYLKDRDNTDKWLACAHSERRECVSSWAQESLQDALTWSYGDEDGHEIVDGANLGEIYFETRLPIVERRLAAGGVRLAKSLEAIFQG